MHLRQEPIVFQCKILNFMSKQTGSTAAVQEASGRGDFDMTSPTCTDISPVIHPPSFPAITQNYYTPSTMNYGTPSHQDTDGLSELQQSGRFAQPVPFPSHNSLARQTSQLSGSALCGAIEVDELSSTSQDVVTLSTTPNKRAVVISEGTGRPNRFAHLTANSSGRSFTRPPQKKPDPAPRQDPDLSQSISISMTSELSRLEVTEDDEQQLRRQGVSIDSIQQTLNLTYPDATDAQKIRKLLQLLANSTITSNRLLAEKEELAQMLTAKTNSSEQATLNYHIERAKLFETRARAAEEKLAQTEQELLEHKRKLHAKDQELSSVIIKLNEVTAKRELEKELEIEKELEHEKAHSALLQEERDKYAAEVQYLRNYVNELEDTLTMTKSNLLEAQTDLREMFAKLSTNESNQLKKKISDLEGQILELGAQLKESVNWQRDARSSDYPQSSLQASQHIEALQLTYQQQVMDKQMEIIALQAQLQQVTTELDEQAQFQATIAEQHCAEKSALEAENRELSAKVSALMRTGTGLSRHVHTDSVMPKIQMELVEETIYSESDANNVVMPASIAPTSSQFKNVDSTPSRAKHMEKTDNLLEQENQHLRQENDKLKSDKTKLKNALKQIKQLQREYEASQNTTPRELTSEEEDNGSKRSSLGSNTEDAVMVPGTMIPRPTQLLKNQINLLKADLGSAKGEIVELQKKLSEKEEARMRLEVEKKLLSEKLEENECRIAELQKDLTRFELGSAHTNVARTHMADTETANKHTSTDPLPEHNEATTTILTEVNARCVALTEQLEQEKQSVSILRDKLSSLEKDKATLLEDVKKKDHSLAEAEAAAKDETEKLTARLADLQGKLDATERQNRSYNSLLATMHSANSANTDKLRSIENREQVELARRDELISILRNEILMHQSEIGLLKKELYLRDEETRRLMKKIIALEAGYFGTSSSHSYYDAAEPVATAADTIGSYPIIDAALRSSSRHIRSQLNTTLESGLNNF